MWLATCVNVEQVGLLLLPSLDAVVLLGERSNVRAHALHHHAVDGGVLLCPTSSHCPGTQLGHTAAGRALFTSLLWKEDNGWTQKKDTFSDINSSTAIPSPTNTQFMIIIVSCLAWAWPWGTAAWSRETWSTTAWPSLSLGPTFYQPRATIN